jgi:DNA-binding LacI/PurR family transcriptional regulator
MTTRDDEYFAQVHIESAEHAERIADYLIARGEYRAAALWWRQSDTHRSKASIWSEVSE